MFWILTSKQFNVLKDVLNIKNVQTHLAYKIKQTKTEELNIWKLSDLLQQKI